MSTVVVLRTSPRTVVDDYARLLELAAVESFLPKDAETIIKLNLSWTKYFPACSSQPWQVEGVVKGLLGRGYAKERLLPVENKTVVTNPREGAINNKWMPVLRNAQLPFIALPEVKWTKYRFKSPLLVMNQIFPDGIEIPDMFIGRSVIHLPTVKTHGHSITTGAIKNSFGGLLKEVRHYCHKHMHETLVDLLYMQKEVHTGLFAAMDGTIAGDGPGPRTLIPKPANLILASGDMVAIDAVAAQIMGFDPMSIPYIRMATELGLGMGDVSKLELVGDDISGINLHFTSKKSFVIWGDQLLRKGALRWLEGPALHSPLSGWAPAASNMYHDGLWYPTVGRARINAFRKTDWGQLFDAYPTD